MLKAVKAGDTLPVQWSQILYIHQKTNFIVEYVGTAISAEITYYWNINYNIEAYWTRNEDLKGTCSESE